MVEVKKPCRHVEGYQCAILIGSEQLVVYDCAVDDQKQRDGEELTARGWRWINGTEEVRGIWIKTADLPDNRAAVAIEFTRDKRSGGGTRSLKIGRRRGYFVPLNLVR